MLELLSVQGGNPGWREALLALLIAFLTAQLIAVVYTWSYRGLSYSRNLVQALVGAGVIACVLMLAIGDNLSRGVGIVGTMALIRFRTNLRDPWDMVFVFAAFAVGIAAGTSNYGVAILGCLVFSGVALLLSHSEFGSVQQFDGLLRLHISSASEAQEKLRLVLQDYCNSFVLITLREMRQGEEHEHAYHVRLREKEGQPAFVSAISSLPGARAVTLHMQEATVEI